MLELICKFFQLYSKYVRIKLRQALFVASMFKAKPVIVNSLFTVKAVLVNSVGLRVFQKIQN